MPFKLIINADDFGFSQAVTNGILHCHDHGLLTSTTLMTTMPDCDRAIDLGGQHPNLGIGLHLSLTQGKPLTPCRRLLSSHGDFFRSVPKLFLKLRSSAARQEAAAELLAQIRYAQTRGLKLTHVDSHKHVCHLPALHQPLIDACLQTHITSVRTAREHRIPGLPPLSTPYKLLVKLAHRLAAKASAAGLATTDWFYGLATTGRTTPTVYEGLAKSTLTGVGELMVHPAYITDITRKETYLLQQRVDELEALCDPRARQALSAAHVELTRYSSTGT